MISQMLLLFVIPHCLTTYSKKMKGGQCNSKQASQNLDLVDHTEPQNKGAGGGKAN